MSQTSTDRPVVGRDAAPLLGQESTTRATPEVDVANTPIAELVVSFPQLEPVLEAHGFDTCCGGHFTPLQAAAKHGVEAAPLLEDLRRALSTSRSLA